MTVSISNLMTYKLDSIQSKQGRPGEEITSKNCFFLFSLILVYKTIQDKIK